MENSPFAHHFPRETMDFPISKSSYPWVYPPQILLGPSPSSPQGRRDFARERLAGEDRSYGFDFLRATRKSRIS